MKKEKGSVTLFVLVSCMFFIIILLLVNIGIINKNSNQEKYINEIAKIYSVNEVDLEEIYQQTLNDNKYLNSGEIRDMIYPVGSIFISTTNQNPENYMGGSWESYGEGRTLIGAGNNGTTTYTNGSTGGSETHTHSGTVGETKLEISQLPSHSHTIPKLSGTTSKAGAHIHGLKAYGAALGGGNVGWRFGGNGSEVDNYVVMSAGDHTHTVTTSESNTGTQGENETHTHSLTVNESSSLSPYIVVYFWIRTK